MANETKVKDDERLRLAESIFGALRSMDPIAHVQGNPRRSEKTTIDGDFNLTRLAALILREYSRTPDKTGS